MKKLIYLTILFFSLNMEIFANPLFDLLNEYSFGVESGPTTQPPFCGVGWGTEPVNQIPDVSLIGDSRSFLLALAEMRGDSKITVINFNRILAFSKSRIEDSNPNPEGYEK